MNIKLLSASLVALFALAFVSYGQEFKSLDEYTRVNSIKMHTPQVQNAWDNPDSFFILELDENVDNSLVGGSKNNPRRHAVLLTAEQKAEIVSTLSTKNEIFISRVPSMSVFYYPTLEKEADILSKIEGALFVHNISMHKHPDANIYESCDSKYCPETVGSHYVAESFQISKKGDKYVMIIGAPLNRGGVAIKWDVATIDVNRSFDETIVEMSSQSYKALFE